VNSTLEELMNQHREAERMLDRLATATRMLSQQGPADRAALAELAACRGEIQHEIDSHFRHEEQGLFPVLGRKVGTDDGPIAALMEEHCTFRRLQLEYEAGLAGLEADAGQEWADRLLLAARDIGSLLPGHIQKEDEVLFPMAESMLEEDEWNEVRNLWGNASSGG
jgi:regulator of cell morphogenesis and NO signaling